MKNSSQHTFHIPVMSLAFTIDTPLRVARYGISSVISIVDDNLTESMRKYHSEKKGIPFEPISDKDDDFRARRITAYLNLVNQMVTEQVEGLKKQTFYSRSDLDKYFQLLPDTSPVRQAYQKMPALTDPAASLRLQNQLKKAIRAGSIDVNIMEKVDKSNVGMQKNALTNDFLDAVSALRGFARSDLSSSVVISARMNPYLYAYLENLEEFYPGDNGRLNKKIILKVSDYRSALVLGKLMANKGLWVSEFRIESGLNCGGHTFATDGYLLGPVLDDFKQKRKELKSELFDLYQQALARRKCKIPPVPRQRVTVQGGIGTSEENQFLLDHYKVDGTGWGSPFLLCPEATNVEESMLKQLAGPDVMTLYRNGIPENSDNRKPPQKRGKKLTTDNEPRLWPSPNLAYFSGSYSLSEMIGHIYGRNDLMQAKARPNMFMIELSLYVDYFRKEINSVRSPLSPVQVKYFLDFKSNLLDGIYNYRKQMTYIAKGNEATLLSLKDQLAYLEDNLLETYQTPSESFFRHHMRSYR
ncbi:MAG: hypothetical protein WD266_09670 [Balneolales bacterium]